MSMHEAEDVLGTAAGWRAAGEQVALATVTETWGSSPRPAGSQMAVTEVRQDGRLGVAAAASRARWPTRR